MKSAEEHGVSENDIQGAECDEREGPSSIQKAQWKQFCKLLEKYSLWAESDLLTDDASISELEKTSFLSCDMDKDHKNVRTNSFLQRNSRRRQSTTFNGMSSNVANVEQNNEHNENAEILSVKKKIEIELQSPLKDIMKHRVKYMNSNDTDNFILYDKKAKCEIKRLKKYITNEELTLYFKYMLYLMQN